MSEQRKAFDIWFEQTRGNAPDRDNLITQFMEEAWNAGEASGMERAAKVCEVVRDEPECPERAQYCADSIRALLARGGE